MEDNKPGKKLITHDGSFHSDDIFACASIQMMLDKYGEGFELFRTRDEKIIKNGDYVFDVGGIHDDKINRFDHHQIGGAGKRENGIEYASFGLVWKKFGVLICGDPAISEILDKKLVTPIDAGDNGMDLVELKRDISPYFIQSALGSFNPGWKDASAETAMQGFLDCVQIARKILSNEIARAKDAAEAHEIIFETYKNTEDKRIVVLDKKYPWYEQMQSYTEPIFIVYPRQDGAWGAEGVALAKFSMVKRKNFPKLWAGLRDEELKNVSGVPDAIFCHRALFMAVAQSKEGAIKLARIALES